MDVGAFLVVPWFSVSTLTGKAAPPKPRSYRRAAQLPDVGGRMWQARRAHAISSFTKRCCTPRPPAQVPSGHFCAIMGPSGCGKSTLLETLSGRLAASASLAGTIAVNGRPTNLSGGRAAFVTQDEACRRTPPLQPPPTPSSTTSHALS